MRYIRYAVLALLAVILITVALANAEPVTLRLLPEVMAGFLGWSWEVTLPLFLVILAGVVVGLLIGFVWEWMREHKHRAASRANRREKDRLSREVTRIKTDTRSRKGDDVLALLE